MTSLDNNDDDYRKELEPWDNGKDRRYESKKTKSKEKVKEENVQKKLKKTVRYALSPDKMFFNKDERNMYAEYFNRFKDDILEAYGTFTTAQELSVDGLCWAIVRLHRKSKLESYFGRFFDRVAPHDPLGQINQTLKSLGLLPEKKEKEVASANMTVKSKLGEEAMNSENAAQELTFKDWLQQKDVPKFEFRTPKELPNYNEHDLVFEDKDDEEMA
jgi:hypothetical protein